MQLKNTKFKGDACNYKIYLRKRSNSYFTVIYQIN